MLGDYPVNIVLLATDLDASKDFYANKVGLKVLTESPVAVTFKCRGEAHLDVTRSTVGTADSQTQAAWQVKDLGAEVEELRSRGVVIEEHDSPDLKTTNGIADLGFALFAWFIDPGKNCMGIVQMK